MAGSTKPCLFCGKVGVKLTNEHVYPRWLHRALNIRGPISYSSQGRRSRVTLELDVQIRKVCADCNHGWLHGLERAFRAAMILPINGLGPVRFARPTQVILALWAVKTCLLLEIAAAHANVDLALEPSPDMFRWLREHGSPTPDTQVWMGAVDAQPEGLIGFSSFKWVGKPPNPPVGITGIFTVGCVLFQVYLPIHGVNGVPVEQTFALGLGPGLTPYLAEIWPHQTEAIRWPPLRVFSVEHLRRLTAEAHFEPGPPPV